MPFHAPYLSLGTTLAASHAIGSGTLTVDADWEPGFAPTPEAPAIVTVALWDALSDDLIESDPAGTTRFEVTGRSGGTLTAAPFGGDADRVFPTGSRLYGTLDPAHLTELQTAVNANTIVGTKQFRDQVLIGGDASAGRLTVQTSSTDALNGADIYHTAGQGTTESNQHHALNVHNYTDGTSVRIDTVGAGTSLILVQAHNPTMRADKPSDYVGTGDFLAWQTTLADGSADVVRGRIDANGNLVQFRDWDGTTGTAPVQLSTASHPGTRVLYLGYHEAGNNALLGAIDLDAAVFTPLHLRVSMLWIVDGTLAIGSGGNQISFGTTQPTTGGLAGDLRWNTAVASGQPEGWRCTAPGTWSPMANHP